MIIGKKTVGIFQSNSFIAACEETSECIIIDPGDEAERICSFIDQRRLTPKFIINTHAHIDHIGAVAELKKRYGIEFYLHKGDLFWLKTGPLQAPFVGMGLGSIKAPSVDRYIKDGDELTFGGHTLRVIHTPGHTSGGVCLLTDNHLFSGDTLFMSSIGRTDLPGGSYRTILQSIRDRLLTLDDRTEVHPGHGPDTTIGYERRTNPFVLEAVSGL